MDMIFLLIALACSLVSLVCNLIIIVDAFKKSVGTGFLVLCVPCYILYYMFTQFEHEQKTLIIAGSLGGGILSNVFQALGGGFSGGGGYSSEF